MTVIDHGNGEAFGPRLRHCLACGLIQCWQNVLGHGTDCNTGSRNKAARYRHQLHDLLQKAIL
ncbi:hypothetical protein [Sphingomonas ursincola]|uniref:hypothetical protein n=1 Tax=Sphingomonas ursincola TaxID=56361 RepID=UPI001E51380C|nr:hypothetical protein [Sphingomonas ursincola]